MSLFYANQQVRPLFGTKNSVTNALTPVAITAAFGATNTTKIIEVGLNSMVAIDLSYTMGATETANSIDVRIRASSDGVNFYTLLNDSTSGGTSTLTARTFTFVGADAANVKVSLPLEVMYRYIEISVKESGVATNAGTLFGEITISGK